MEIVLEALKACPRLAVHLGKILDRCDKRGGPSGTLKLGDTSLPARELRVLRHLFGPSLKTSRRGVHRLNLTQFLNQIPAPETWIDDVYRALGRERQNLVEKKQETNSNYQRLLEQLRLAHPEQTTIYAMLARNNAPREMFEQEAAEKLRRQWFALADLVAFLCNNHPPIGLSELAAKFFNDSKKLRTGKLKSQLCHWLKAIDTDGQNDTVPADKLLETFGVTDNPTSIKVTFFGNMRYRKEGILYDWPGELRKNGESVTLSLDNLANVDFCEFPGNDTIITCENETPFNALIRDDTSLPIVYTAGFPNAAVRSLLEALSANVKILHWGDSDLAGFRIAGILGRIRPLSLWRCNLSELKRHGNMLRPIREAERQAIFDMLDASPNHPFSSELHFTAENGWLEQESWQQLT